MLVEEQDPASHLVPPQLAVLLGPGGDGPYCREGKGAGEQGRAAVAAPSWKVCKHDALILPASVLLFLSDTGI